MTTKKVIKIGFDLDGVIINKPPFVPKGFLEWFVRSHRTKTLSYRYPSMEFERKVRWLSHHPVLRPPIKKNIEIVRRLHSNKNCEIYVISSRFKFLEDRTNQWFKTYHLEKIFNKIFINLGNEQPHIFKERMIRKLKLNVFVDDDFPLVRYLKRKVTGVKIISIGQHRKFFEKFITDFKNTPSRRG